MENQHDSNLLPCYSYPDGKIVVIMDYAQYNEINNILRSKVNAREKYREYKRNVNSKVVVRRTKDLILGPVQMVPAQ